MLNKRSLAQASQGSLSKKLHIKTFGCQMNAYNSERMAEALEPAGYVLTEDQAEADLVILNTCHIREKAAEKVYSELGRVRLAKEARRREGRDTLVAVAGCVAQAEGAEIMARAPDRRYRGRPAKLSSPRRRLSPRPAARGKKVLATDFPAEDKFAHLPERSRAKVQISAFVTVQEGCDKFCTFCVVPYTRGAEYSRTPLEIIAEVERLAANGTREITLLGQNVNAYHGTGPDGRAWTLAKLLRRLAEVPSIERLRFTTSHPLDMDDELIALFGDEPKLMPYLHLPFQSGSDRILKAMNRRHTAAEYEAVIGKVREARPDIALSTDIIVGFPGETDRRLRVRPWRWPPAPASPRPSLLSIARGRGRQRQASNDQVPEAVKRERLYALQSLIDGDRHAFDRATVGRRLDVLFEGTRAETRTDRRAFTLSTGGACGGTRDADRPDRRG